MASGVVERRRACRRVLGGERRHVNHLEARGGVAQQAVRAGDVPARQHEAVGAGGERRRRGRAATWRRPGKLSNVRSSRNSSSRNVAGSLPAPARGVEEGRAPRRTHRGPSAARRDRGRRKRRGGGDRLQEPLGRGRRALDVDVLRRGPAAAFAQPVQQRRAAGAAAAEQDRNARGRRVERRETRRSRPAAPSAVMPIIAR